jgi:hypothetical protein
MATEAQVSANRSNAQKSTGPRTPEGKAAVAQNAVQHGLLAQEVVIKGENPGEFELYRDGMLEELAPAGQMESLLAARIVGLSWRLRRAERLQGAAFDTLEEKKKKPAKPIWSDEARGWVFPQTAKESEDESLVVARRVVQDFAQARILDRLLIYERRIEHSLYRTMAELRNLRAERREEGAKVRRSEAQTVLPSSLPTFSPSSVPLSSDDVTTNVPEARGPSCETKPIPAGRDEDHVPCSEKMEEVGRERPTLDQVEGRLYEEPPDGVTTNVPEAQEPPCETKPIGLGPSGDQASYDAMGQEVGRGRPTYEETPEGQGPDRAKRTQFDGAKCAKRSQFLRSARGPEDEMRKTNPISGGARYPTIPVFYHSTIPFQCRLCETKPICLGRPGMGAGSRGREAPPGTDRAKRTQLRKKFQV